MRWEPASPVRAGRGFDVHEAVVVFLLNSRGRGTRPCVYPRFLRKGAAGGKGTLRSPGKASFPGGGNGQQAKRSSPSGRRSYKGRRIPSPTPDPNLLPRVLLLSDPGKKRRWTKRFDFTGRESSPRIGGALEKRNSRRWGRRFGRLNGRQNSIRAGPWPARESHETPGDRAGGAGSRIASTP